VEPLNRLDHPIVDVPTVVACPSCGYRFKRPFWGESNFASGYTITGLGFGVLTCPKCSYKTSTRSFKKSSLPQSTEPGARELSALKEESKTGNAPEHENHDAVDESKPT
jgi:DNA-directed RNA polymerase subunit M/transcription elongation factor TFIIS